MGFGILLIGYVLSFAFSLSSVYFFADVIGGLLITYAFTKLSSFSPSFKAAIGAGLFFTLSSILNAVNTFVFSGTFELLLRFENALSSVSVIVLHLIMLSAISSFSQSLGLSKIRMKSIRNLIIMILYFTLYTLTLLYRQYLISQYPVFSNFLFKFLIIYQFLWLILNIILIGSCMKWIGVEGEELHDQKSKLHKLNDLWSEKEKKIFTPKEYREDNRNNDITKEIHKNDSQGK